MRSNTLIFIQFTRNKQMLNKAVYLELLGTEWNWLELFGKPSFCYHFCYHHLGFCYQMAQK